MKLNLGTFDRVLRIVLALVLALLLVTGTLSGTFGWVLGIAAIVLLVTGVISFCPLYALLRLSTRKAEPPAQPR